MARSAFLLVCLALSATPAAAAQEGGALLRARQAYNQRNFDVALGAADDARRSPELADAADLIAARALLERFREHAAADDLAQARERLRRLAPARLAARERIEYIVGLGEALYLDEAPGAAAAVFESVLSLPDPALLDGRELVLDWWASAIEQQARPRAAYERQPLYDKVRDRMTLELARNPASGTAAYWMAAVARAQGDLQSAWDEARAGWVRALLVSDGGAALRGDLDRLVQRGIIPERARMLGQSPDELRDDWEAFKARWSR